MIGTNHTFLRYISRVSHSLNWLKDESCVVRLSVEWRPELQKQRGPQLSSCQEGCGQTCS